MLKADDSDEVGAKIGLEQRRERRLTARFAERPIPAMVLRTVGTMLGFRF
jgi:hypothetical protein